MPDPTQGLPLPIGSPDPSAYSDYLNMQRQQMLADMLMGNYQRAATTPPQWDAMRAVPRRSPISNLATLGSALLGGKALHGAQQSEMGYLQDISQAGSDLIGQATGKSGNPSDYGTRMDALNRAMRFGLINPDVGKQIGEQIAAENKPADLDKTLRAAGIMPETPEYQAVMAKAAAKETYIAPISERPGAELRNPLNPGEIIGYNPQWEWHENPAKPGTGYYTHTPNPPGTSPEATGMVPKGTPPPGMPQTPAPPAAPPAATPAAQPPGKSPYFNTAPGTYSAGDLAAQQEMGKDGLAYAGELQANSKSALGVLRHTAEIQNLAQTAPPSAANPGRLAVGRVLVAMGADPAWVSQHMGSTADPHMLAALEAAKKQTGEFALDSIHKMTSRGTNFDLQTFMGLNPNLNMGTKEGFDRVVEFINKSMGNEINRFQDFGQWRQGKSPTEWRIGHSLQWDAKERAEIAAGAANSTTPTAKPITKQIGNKTYYSLGGGRWSDTAP
jgi:hypothetical protein